MRGISKYKTYRLLRFICFPYIIVVRAYRKYKNRNILYYKDLFSNVIDGRLIVNIIDVPGRFEIDARSDILQRILINKHYERDIVSLIRKIIQADRDAINVGANIGIFTILMAGLINKGRRVLAVEPTPLAFNKLVTNIEANKQKDKVIVFNGICYDTPGSYYLNTIQGKEEYSSMGESIHMSNTQRCIDKLKVKGETINNLTNSFNLNPGIILMDVEGAEMRVLAGADIILSKYKPIIISELDDDLLRKQGTSSMEVFRFLNNIGYEIRAINKKGKIRYPFRGNIVGMPKQ